MKERFKKSLFIWLIRISIYCAIFLVLLQGCDNLTVSEKYNIVIDDSNVGGINVWKKYFLMKNVENAIKRVTQYFEIPYKGKLHVYILDSKVYEGKSNTIFLSKDGYRKKDMLEHEITHALLKPKESNFEMEGLAMLMEFNLINDEKLVKQRCRSDCKIYPIQYLMDNDQLFTSGSRIQKCAYLQTGSFYLFLDEKYGRKKMIEFYTQGVRRIESVYGVPLDSLDAAWQKWLVQ